MVDEEEMYSNDLMTLLNHYVDEIGKILSKIGDKPELEEYHDFNECIPLLNYPTQKAILIDAYREFGISSNSEISMITYTDDYVEVYRLFIPEKSEVLVYKDTLYNGCYLIRYDDKSDIHYGYIDKNFIAFR